MGIDQKLDQLLREAIGYKRLLRFGYKGNERMVEPHDYGIQNGIVRLLCWQMGGKSRSRVPGWRLIDVAEMQIAKCSTVISMEIGTSYPVSIITGMKFSFASGRKF
jgi:hypothetical protein